MKKVVHFEVHFVILYSKTELLRNNYPLFKIMGIKNSDKLNLDKIILLINNLKIKNPQLNK